MLARYTDVFRSMFKTQVSLFDVAEALEFGMPVDIAIALGHTDHRSGGTVIVSWRTVGREFVFVNMSCTRVGSRKSAFGRA